MEQTSPFWAGWRTRTARALRVDLTHAQHRYARVLSKYVACGSRWLDIGCGHQVMPPWAMSERDQREIVSRCDLLFGIDVDEGMKANKLLTHRAWALGEHLPFAPETFTLVTANMVVEHLSDPAAVLEEVNRVLKPAGCFIFHTVNQKSFMKLANYMVDSMKVTLARHLEARTATDVFPTHYRLNTEPLIREAAEKTNFEVEVLEYAQAPGFFWRLGPLGVAELPFVKVLQTERFRRLGTNLILVLRKRQVNKPSHRRLTAMPVVS